MLREYVRKVQHAESAHGKRERERDEENGGDNIHLKANWWDVALRKTFAHTGNTGWGPPSFSFLRAKYVRTWKQGKMRRRCSHESFRECGGTGMERDCFPFFKKSHKRSKVSEESLGNRCFGKGDHSEGKKPEMRQDS